MRDKGRKKDKGIHSNSTPGLALSPGRLVILKKATAMALPSIDIVCQFHPTIISVVDDLVAPPCEWPAHTSLPWLGFQCKMVCDQRSSSHRTKAPANHQFLAFSCRDHGTSLYQESKLAIFSAASCKYSGQSTQSLRQQIRNTRRNIFLLATSNSWAILVKKNLVGNFKTIGKNIDKH